MECQRPRPRTSRLTAYSRGAQPRTLSDMPSPKMFPLAAASVALAAALTGCVNLNSWSIDTEDAVRIDTPPEAQEELVNLEVCEAFLTDRAILLRTLPKEGASYELLVGAWSQFSASASRRASEAVDGTLVGIALSRLEVESAAYSNVLASGDDVSAAQIDSVNAVLESAFDTCTSYTRQANRTG